MCGGDRRNEGQRRIEAYLQPVDNEDFTMFINNYLVASANVSAKFVRFREGDTVWNTHSSTNVDAVLTRPN